MNRTDFFQLIRVASCDGMEIACAEHVNHAFPRHTHDTCVIQVVESGEDVFECAGQLHRARAGDIVAIPPGLAHSGMPGGGAPLRYRSFYPSGELVRSLSGVTEPPDRPLVLSDADLAAALNTAHRRMCAPRAAVQEHSVEALAEALQFLFQSSPRAKSAVPVRSRHPIAVQAQEYLDAHFLRPVSLRELSEVTGASPWHVQRVFKSAFGLTPQEYVIDRRIARARIYLRQGRSAVEVALDTGFCDQSHFSRVFRRHVGVSPGHYGFATAG
jgi:AraC-like DNA-binding protein